MKRTEPQKLLNLELSEYPQPEFVQLEHPVLLCHGYGAVVSIIKPSPMHEVCMKLREHAVVSFAPNIVPYAKIETRAQQWTRIIGELTDRYHFRKLNVIAHSMAGLDMRYAISHLGMHRHVASLTTVATPHRGTSLAELVLHTPDMVRESLAEVFNWFGNNMYPHSKSDSAGAVAQLTRDYIRKTFNPSCPDREEVTYFSYSAGVGKGTDHPLNAIYRFQNNHIHAEEGANDSFVSVESARWGEHIRTIPLSHLEQIKLSLSKERKELFDRFWLEAIRELASRGF